MFFVVSDACTAADEAAVIPVSAYSTTLRALRCGHLHHLPDYARRLQRGAISVW